LPEARGSRPKNAHEAGKWFAGAISGKLVCWRGALTAEKSLKNKLCVFNGEKVLKTNHSSHSGNSQTRHFCLRLVWLLLILLSTSAGWQLPPTIAQGQTAGVRFTELLKF
jgi:hypothetical protein